MLIIDKCEPRRLTGCSVRLPLFAYSQVSGVLGSARKCCAPPCIPSHLPQVLSDRECMALLWKLSLLPGHSGSAVSVLRAVRFLRFCRGR